MNPVISQGQQTQTETQPERHEPTVEVRLVGGPADLPEAARSARVPAASARQRIKVAHRAGYEHFEPAAQDDGPGPVVFRWIGFTKIAE